MIVALTVMFRAESRLERDTMSRCVDLRLLLREGERERERGRGSFGTNSSNNLIQQSTSPKSEAKQIVFSQNLTHSQIIIIIGLRSTINIRFVELFLAVCPLSLPLSPIICHFVTNFRCSPSDRLNFIEISPPGEKKAIFYVRL